MYGGGRRLRAVGLGLLYRRARRKASFEAPQVIIGIQRLSVQSSICHLSSKSCSRYHKLKSYDSFIEQTPWRLLRRATRPETGLRQQSQRKPHCNAIYVRGLERQKYVRSDAYASATENAVDPQNYEPNLALDLEIADLINSKKGNA